MKNLKVLFGFCFMVFVCSESTYDCRTKNVIQLKSREVAFFQTPGFPKLWFNDLFLKCIITFNLFNNETNHRLYVRFTLLTINYDGGLDAPFTEHTVLNKTIFKFSDLFNIINFHTYDMAAFRGFIIFDDERNICPMEAPLNTYALKDETQIFTIKSGYEENHNRTKSCKWKFSAPFGYGFKIVVENFHTSSKFIIENTTQIFVNERSVRKLYPFYNSDNFIQISLSRTISTTHLEFKAYISLVKMGQTKQKVKCTLHGHGNIITWSNFNSINDDGYHNNVYCDFELIIPSNTEINVVMNFDGVEKGVDYIQYFYDFDNSTGKFADTSNFKIQAHYDGKDRKMLWEFFSDGNFEAIGFAVTFEKIYCQCAEHILACDDTLHGIMGDMDNFYYCSNLNCVFKIQPCNTSITMFQVYSYNTKTPDVLKVLSNNETVLEINALNILYEHTYTAYLNSLNTNYFIAETYPSSYIKALHYMVTPAVLPEVTTRINLSLSAPSSAIDISFNSFVVIEISPELNHLNLSIFLYYMNPKNLELYNNESLTHNIIDKNCFGTFNVYRCEVKRNKIAILVKDFTGARIFVAEIRIKSKGCVFSDSTFVVTSDSKIGTLANFESHCDFTILLTNSENFYVHTFWTTAKNDSVQMFAGTDYSSKLFLEFTSTSAKTWNPIVLNSEVYKLRIPKGSAIFLAIKQNVLDPDKSFQYPYKTLFTIPNYGLAETPDYPNTLDFNVKSFSAKFTAIDFEIDASDVVYFQDLNTKKIYNINKIGDFII